MPEEGEPGISVSVGADDGTTRGAIVTPAYVERDVIVYGITDVEMDNLSLLNATLSALWSSATFFLGLAVAAIVSGLISPPPPGADRAYLTLLIVVLLLIGLGCAGALIPFYRRRRTIRDQIQISSKQITKQ